MENKTLEETEEIFKKEELKNNLIKAIRKNPQKVLKLLKRKKYYHEDNYENVIINMLNSGIGRRGRRQLSKKMMVDWKTYLEMEDTIITYASDKLNSKAKRSMVSRYRNMLRNKEMSIRQYQIRMLILEDDVTWDEAEKEYDQSLI